MAYEQEKKDLASHLWTRVATDDAPLVNARMLARAIGLGAKSFNAKVIEYLDTFVDVSNNDVPLPYVDNPQADQVVYTGRWRLVSNSWNGQSSRYVQVLRLGWVTATPESDAVFVNIERSNQSGKLTLVRKWQFIDPSVVELLMKSSNDNPNVLANVVTDPQADGKTYVGEWLAITTQGPKSEYGECTIIQTLIKAGDANLTVILGTNKTTSSREVYKWQTTAEDLDAFRTHTGEYAGEFDYKWGTNETGIQKDWNVTQGADMSLNLVARYIVKEEWFYPTNGTDFIVVNNLNGIFTESVRKFKNSTLPVASTGELVKALEDELGQFSGEVIKRSIVEEGGSAKIFVSTSAAIYEWHRESDVAKIPLMTTSTDPTNHPQRITGHRVVKIITPFRRKVVVKVERQYYNSMPSVTEIVDGDFVADNAGYVDGGGVAITKNIIEITEGLYAIEKKTITTDDWTQLSLSAIVLYTTSYPSA